MKNLLLIAFLFVSILAGFAANSPQSCVVTIKGEGDAPLSYSVACVSNMTHSLVWNMGECIVHAGDHLDANYVLGASSNSIVTVKLYLTDTCTTTNGTTHTTCTRTDTEPRRPGLLFCRWYWAVECGFCSGTCGSSYDPAWAIIWTEDPWE